MDEKNRIDDATMLSLWSTGTIHVQAKVGEQRSGLTIAILPEELGAGDTRLFFAMASTLDVLHPIADLRSAAQREALLLLSPQTRENFTDLDDFQTHTRR